MIELTIRVDFDLDTYTTIPTISCFDHYFRLHKRPYISESCHIGFGKMTEYIRNSLVFFSFCVCVKFSLSFKLRFTYKVSLDFLSTLTYRKTRPGFTTVC